MSAPISGAGGVNQVIALRQQILDQSSALRSLQQNSGAQSTASSNATAGGLSAANPVPNIAGNAFASPAANPAPSSVSGPSPLGTAGTLGARGIDGVGGRYDSGAIAGTPGAGFADTLQNAMQSVNATQHHAKNVTEAYERGEITDVASVMLARQESSVAFEATLQVRNKLLAAYQDIMRMGV